MTHELFEGAKRKIRITDLKASPEEIRKLQEEIQLIFKEKLISFDPNDVDATTREGECAISLIITGPIRNPESKLHLLLSNMGLVGWDLESRSMIE
ncbi:hypothetical protein [Vreelandella aquamarina]|uniref:hypothetical protein n=1 Tax=Vreelandella aquamarina TaxID=77097 RepID=UPI00384AEB9E